MRYPKNHKEQVRQQLLLKAGSHAKEHGFDASGVEALAGAAGLTTGSLYKHFENKNALFTALVTTELTQTISRYRNVTLGDKVELKNVLNSYLSMAHVRESASGCPVPTLAAEVARSSDEVRNAFEAGIFELKKILTDHTGSESKAWTLMAQNVGAVMIARAMMSDDARRELLSAVRDMSSNLLKDDEIACSKPPNELGPKI
jgi:TetR/AcrR family transcriptional regulator, transcriptional repressor for nem operon